MEPIYICAVSHIVARNFVVIDLNERPDRLRFIERADQLQGFSHFILFIHPTANQHPSFLQIRNMAEQRGAIFARIDDSYSRARWLKENK